MSDRRLLFKVLAPFAVAVLVTGWLIWARQAPGRQGGYCMNATVEIAGVLQRADRTGDVGRGPLPPIAQIFAEVKSVDVTRFQVNTPPEVADDVAQLAKDRDPQAFANIVQDYLTRCRTASTAAS